MDKEEARQVLSEQHVQCRKKTYAELKGLLDNPDTFELIGGSETTYQIEYQIIWDNPGVNDDLRVLLSIDDASLRSSFFPISQDFAVSPDGSFVGE